MPLEEKPTNGNHLPESRKAAIEQGLQFFQETAAERDLLKLEVDRLKQELAAHKVVIDGMDANLNDMRSQVTTARLERDQAWTERLTYEALFVSIQAQLRAFKVPAAPLITDKETDENVGKTAK